MRILRRGNMVVEAAALRHRKSEGKGECALIIINESSFRLDTDSTTYLFGRTKYGHLEHIYYGNLLSKEDEGNVLAQKRSIAVGSLGGLAAARRGECDFAPIHLFDEKTESYNTPYLADGLELVPESWQRSAGLWRLPMRQRVRYALDLPGRVIVVRGL